MKNFLNKSYIFLFTFLLISSSLLAEAPSARIVNGVNGSQGEYPFMAYLQFETQNCGSWYCGGSYIGGQLILTAAHCMPSDCGSWSATATLNRTDLNSSNGQTYYTKVAYVHPNYDAQNISNDLAVLELYDTPAGISPLNLVSADKSSLYNEGTITTIMGWGSILQREDESESQASYPDIMQKASVPIRSDNTCFDMYDGDYNPDTMFCAGDLDIPQGSGIDTCQGDSGGPIIVNDLGTYKQIGIVSWGIGCASSQYYGLYTRLINYLDWVQNVFEYDTDDVAPSITVNSGRCRGQKCSANVTCTDPSPSIGINKATAKLISRDGGDNQVIRLRTSDGSIFSGRRQGVTSGRYTMRLNCIDNKGQTSTVNKRVKVR